MCSVCGFGDDRWATVDDAGAPPDGAVRGVTTCVGGSAAPTATAGAPFSSAAPIEVPGGAMMASDRRQPPPRDDEQSQTQSESAAGAGSETTEACRYAADLLITNCNGLSALNGQHPPLKPGPI